MSHLLDYMIKTSRNCSQGNVCIANGFARWWRANLTSLSSTCSMLSCLWAKNLPEINKICWNHSWKMALLLTSYWLHNGSWQLLSAPGQEYKSYGNLGCAPSTQNLQKKIYSDKKTKFYLPWLLAVATFGLTVDLSALSHCSSSSSSDSDFSRLL